MFLTNESSAAPSLFLASCPFGKLSVRQNVRSAKRLFGKMSIRQNVFRQSVFRQNVRVPKLHSQLFNSDVLAFTETQLLAKDSDTEITANLKPFTIYRQDHDSDKYSSMAICIRDTLQMVDYEYFPSLNALKFVLVDTKLKETRTFLLLYKKNNSNVSQYIESLEYLLNIDKIDMVLGDFNINYFNGTHSQPLISLMESLNYTQIVSEPTFVSAGSLLDHVYVKPTSIRIMNNSVVSVYYSDHDAIVTSLQFSNNVL